jgi:hypothetical protein
MPLTRVEPERITDSRLKIQAVAHRLKGVDPQKVPDFEEIEECLEDADKSLGGALRSSVSDPPKRSASRLAQLGRRFDCPAQTEPWMVCMQIETQFLRLTKPVPLGDRIDGWRVAGWAGGISAASSLW